MPVLLPGKGTVKLPYVNVSATLSCPAVGSGACALRRPAGGRQRGGAQRGAQRHPVAPRVDGRPQRARAGHWPLNAARQWQRRGGPGGRGYVSPWPARKHSDDSRVEPRRSCPLCVPPLLRTINGSSPPGNSAAAFRGWRRVRLGGAETRCPVVRVLVCGLWLAGWRCWTWHAVPG